MKNSDDIKMHLSDRISARIEKLGLNRNQAAERCGVAPERISEIRHYKQGFSIDILIRLLAHLGEQGEFSYKVPRK